LPIKGKNPEEQERSLLEERDGKRKNRRLPVFMLWLKHEEENDIKGDARWLGWVS